MSLVVWRKRISLVDGQMVITIDGPAGAGKSSVARGLADRLGFRFLDTGAMYRTVAYAAMQRSISWDDDAALADLARSIDIDVSEDRVLMDGEDVTNVIRTMEVTSVIHYVADHAGIRELLVDLQRRCGASGDFVTEGRDQGTVAFPDAACKIFLTASPAERARRRQKDLLARGEEMPFEDVLKRQEERDERDRNREVGRLVAAKDACLVSTDNKSMDQVIDELESLVKKQLASKSQGPYEYIWPSPTASNAFWKCSIVGFFAWSGHVMATTSKRAGVPNRRWRFM